jgi:outer membrane protein assembly factor BamB
VVGDKVFVTCYSGLDSGIQNLKRHLVCVSKSDGKVLWDKTVPAVQPEDEFQGFLATEHGYASNTPASDGERVYVFFGKTGALAFDLEGKQLWHTELGTRSNSRRWGSAASVMLTAEHVVVNALDEGGAVFGLEKATGKVAWKAPAEGLELAYSTPVLVKHDGVEDIVLAVPQEIWGINPASGKLRWYATHGLGGNVSPGVVIGEGEAYIFGGYPRTASVGIKLGGKDDITKNISWNSEDSSYVPSPVLHEGHLYVVSDQGFATCMEAKTGKTLYKERIMESSGGGRRGGGKPFYASPVLADGKLFCVSRKNGTFVLAAKPKYEVLAKNVIDLDTTQFNSTPAVDGNRLFIRSEKALYAVGEK